MPVSDQPSASALSAVAELYHQYMTGLILAVSLHRGRHDAGEWAFRVFRHQHHEKFLSSFDKLGLTGMPDAVACAAYHYLSNSVGGVGVQFMQESEKKAWVRFVPPRWIYPDATICGVPSEVSRGMLRGWYAQNGISLNNPRLGFICTAQTPDAQHGLAGYFLEHDRDLGPDERLRFSPGELPPPFDAAAAPKLPAADWPAERLAKANRNYAMEYVRTGLPRMAELFGPAETLAIAGHAARMIGAQTYLATAAGLGIQGDSPADFARFLAAMAAAEGDAAEVSTDGGTAVVRRHGWRLTRNLPAQHPCVFEAWNGLFEGALMVHNRFCVLTVTQRLDYGDPHIEWRIRVRPTHHS
ncbi:MAG: hypothetical protein KDC18_10310 [Alphaproteobacteria bacterium]|nr:hypothetical protein [Alphaproteobacteria bacterium]MCB9930915.1 hypothetical protein [Alphaproteobacteria bacterium]